MLLPLAWGRYRSFPSVDGIRHWVPPPTSRGLPSIWRPPLLVKLAPWDVPERFDESRAMLP